METTAAQIVNRKGDADLALGSSFGADSGIAPIYGDTDTSGIQKTGDLVFQYTFQKNREIYNKKIADRDKLRSLMDSEEVNPGVLLDKDRQYIEENYRNKIHDLLVQNPDISSDNTKYQELQKLMQGFKEAKAYGGVRLAAIKDLDKQIASELDPKKKAAMEAHKQNILNEDIYKMPKPFQQTLDWDPNQIFTKPAPITGETERAVGDSIVTMTTQHTPLKQFTIDTWGNYLNNENKLVPDQMDLFAKNFSEMPDAYKAQQVAMWNEKIKQANDQEGLKPGDQYYVPPINGTYYQGRYVVSATTPELVRANAILKNYVNSESESAKVSKLPSEIEKNKADTHKTLKEADVLIPSQAALNYANAAKARADAKKTTQEAQDQRDKAELTKSQGNFYIQEAIQAFDTRNYRGLPRLNGDGTMRWTDGSGKEVQAEASLKGIPGIVLHTKQGGQTITSLSPFQLQAMGLRVKINGQTTIIDPTTVVYNDTNKKNPMMFLKYEYDEEGEEQEVNGVKTQVPGKHVVKTATVKPLDFIKGAIKSAVGEDAAGKENLDYATTMAEYRKRAGSENINGTILQQAETDINKPATSILEKKNKFFK